MWALGDQRRAWLPGGLPPDVRLVRGGARVTLERAGEPGRGPWSLAPKIADLPPARTVPSACPSAHAEWWSGVEWSGVEWSKVKGGPGSGRAREAWCNLPRGHQTALSLGQDPQWEAPGPWPGRKSHAGDKVLPEKSRSTAGIWLPGDPWRGVPGVSVLPQTGAWPCRQSARGTTAEFPRK